MDKESLVGPIGKTIDPGFVFLIGVYGKRVTPGLVRHIKETGASGILLLSRNIDSPEQVRDFVGEIQERLGRPLIVSIDHEGGWVLRFSKGVTAFPGNAALGRARDSALAYKVGSQMARELSWMGINLNLAPVLDVSGKNYNPGIGMRSFGKNAALAARLGAAFIRGLQNHGVGACAKHFPGKGGASVDAHFDLPTVQSSKKEIRGNLIPFQAAVRAGVESVMSSHVIFPALDSVPATFSKVIARDLIRKKLGFKGVMISDDLTMGAVTKYFEPEAAAVKAFEAGHDFLIVAHNEEGQKRTIAAFRRGARKNSEIERRVIESAGRLRRLFRPVDEGIKKPSRLEGDRLGFIISEKAVELARKGSLRLPFDPQSGPTLLLFPDFSEISALFTFEDGPEGPEKLVRRIVGSSSARKIVVKAAPVTSAGACRLEPEIKKARRIIFFCFEAMRFPGQRNLAELLNRQAASRTAACLIRCSWDARLLSRRMTVLDVHGFRNYQLRAALNAIMGKRDMTP